MLVYCRQCKKKVEDCAHFVPPLGVKSVDVFDPKVRSLAYSPERRILEIAFKSGQVWQLFGITPDIYKELLNATLSSFLKFLAHRYDAAPVRQRTLSIPKDEPCPQCRALMTQEHNTGGLEFARVRWACAQCKTSYWRTYGERERKKRWH
jgi:hypothetical protein